MGAPNWRDAVEYALKRCAMTSVDDWRAASWGIRCHNAGFDGASTRDWLARCDDDVLALKPDLVIVLGTRNDWTFEIPALESAKNLEKLLRRLQAAVPHLVYATSFEDAERENAGRSREHFAAMLDVAERLDVSAVDLLAKMATEAYESFYTFELDEDNVVTGEHRGDRDMSHPNARGNCHVAAILLRRIFGIDFDADTYLSDTLSGLKYPRFWPA